MSLKHFIRLCKTRLLRYFLVRNIENLVDVQLRNKDFNSMHDKICELGTDSLDYFGNSYKFEGGYYLQQNPDEFAALCFFLRDHGPYTNFLEIGTASGGTCLALYKIVGFKNILSIDDGKHKRAVYQREHLSQIPNVRQFIGDSHSVDAEIFLRKNLEGLLDIAFIDGDHSFDGVWQDVQLVSKFSSHGTLFIFHDTVASKGVEDVWLRCIRKKIVVPIAEYIGKDSPMGIGVSRLQKLVEQELDNQ